MFVSVAHDQVITMLARVSALGCLVLSAAAMPREGIQPAAAGATNKNVLQVAAAIPELRVFVQAVKAANLTDVLSSPAAFTVFAPTNEAFGQLPPGRLESLLDPTNIDELRAVLLYNIVQQPEAIFSKDLTEGAVKTMEGESVDIKLHDGIMTQSNGAIFIDRARVNRPDLTASNGVIHTIGGVLEPLGINHLYFRYLTGEYNCGQVDAGPRMPISIFDKQNAAALQMYIDATLAFSWLPDFPWRRLELGTCSGNFAGFDIDGEGNSLGINPVLNIPCKDITDGGSPWLPDNRTIDWAPEKLMKPLCGEYCDCNYRGHSKDQNTCKDVPDNPLAESWCSLCGPLFNRPIQIQCFKTEEHY